MIDDWGDAMPVRSIPSSFALASFPLGWEGDSLYESYVAQL